MGTINTRISYLYRDADNYKMQNSCVIMGVITEAQIAEIISCLDCGEYFIPRQVGLPEKRFDRFDEEADHCWFELSADGFEAVSYTHLWNAVCGESRTHGVERGKMWR